MQWKRPTKKLMAACGGTGICTVLLLGAVVQVGGLRALVARSLKVFV